MKRCEWVKLDEPLYVEYHDKEWGVPIYDDQRLFEMICLEGAQAGLSWWTILQRETVTERPLTNLMLPKSFPIPKKSWLN